MSRRLLNLAVIALLTASPAAGQPADLEWASRRFGLDAGLPQSSVNAMEQGSEGFLWLATYGGLARFDGRRFAIMSSRDEGDVLLPRILSLTQDREGRIWVGTQGAGLGIVDDIHLRARPLDPTLNAETVHALLADRQGRMWAATESGVARVAADGQVTWFRSADGLAANQSYRLTEDADGNIWVIGHGGISRISGDRVDAPIRRPEGVFFPPAPLVVQADGTILLGTSVPGGALHRWDGARFVEVARHFLDRTDRVTAMLAREDGTLLVGTDHGLVGVMQGTRFRPFKAAELGRSRVTQILARPGGGYWIGTVSTSLIELTPQLTRWVDPTGRPYGSTGAVAIDAQGTVWAGLGCAGVLQAPSGRPVQRFVLKQCVGALLPDGEAGLWVGTERGLFRWQPGQSLAAQPLVAGSVTAIARDGRGRLLVGADHDVWRREESGAFTKLTPQSDGAAPINVIAEHPSGDLWVGTQRGVIRIAGNSVVDDAVPALRGRTVRAIHIDADQRIWLGTYGAGLWVIDGDAIRPFGVNSGLPEQVISWIGEDDTGNLWLTGNRGVHRLNRDRLLARVTGGPTVPSLSVLLDPTGHPMETNGGFQPAAWWTGNGLLLVPTIVGPVLVDTARTTEPKTGPPIHLDAITIDQVPAPTADTLTIQPASRRVEFAFSAINFQAAAQAVYQYRLDPYDEQWVTNFTGRAVYTGVPPGNYTFQVRALNSQGIPSAAPILIPVRVVPRFTQTPAFLALLVAGMVALVLSGAWGWSAASRAREAALKREVERTVSELKILSGLLPICAWCKKIRNDRGYWSQLETYIQEHSQADFTHSICEDCAQTVWEEHDGARPGAPPPDQGPPARDDAPRSG